MQLVAHSWQIAPTGDTLDTRAPGGTPDPNYAPEWNSPPPSLVFFGGVGGSFDFGPYASDPNSDPLTHSLQSGAWDNVSYSVPGVLSVDANTAPDARNVLLRVTDPSGAYAEHSCLVTVSPSFWLYSVYSAWITAKGGTPIPQSNLRYWDAPTYPTTGTVYASIAALNAAIAAAAPGTILRLANGTYANATITCGVSGVTVAAQTKGGVSLSGNSVVNVTGNSVDVMGFRFTGPYSTQNCVDVTGTDAVIAYCTITITARGTAGAPNYTQVKNLVNAFGARTRVCYCTETGYRGAGRFVEVLKSSAPYPTYCRIDHNYVGDHWCAVDTGGAECIKVGQAQYDVDYYALVDHNHIYRWGNNAGTSGPNSEQEQTSIKSSANFIASNVYEECRGAVNLRNAWDCAVYGNYFLGNGFADAGGVGMFGRNHLVACNFFADLNSAGTATRATLRIGNGNDTVDDYWAARDCEFSFNTAYNCRRVLVFAPLTDRTYGPDNTKFYNNALDIHTGHNATEIVTAGDADTDTVWAGNVIEPTVGRTAAGITAATPALTLTNGVRVPTAAGNCDNAAQAGYSAVITLDALGNAIGSDLGAFQATPTANPWQTIMDGAGA